MDAAEKMSHVCRTCLEEITDINYIQLNDDTNNIKVQLIDCIPELDIDLVPNACVCVFCAHALQNAYDFKLKCLQSESVIRNYAKERAVPDLDVISRDFRLSNDVYEAGTSSGIGLEVIYIRDDAMETEDVQPFLYSKESTLQSKSEKSNHFNVVNAPLSDVAVSNTSKSNTNRIKSEELKLQSQVTYASKKSVYKTFDCSKCNFKATRSFLLKQHMLMHDVKLENNNANVKINLGVTPNGFKGYICDVCPFRTSHKKKLSMHKQTHNNYVCNVCNFKAITSCGLSSHLNAHKRVSLKKKPKVQQSPLTNGEKPNKPLLSEDKSSKNLKITIKLLKKRASEQTRQYHIAHKSNHKCTKCSYEASTLSRLRKHLSTHKPNVHKCTKCNYECKDKSMLVKHYSTHLTKIKSEGGWVFCPNCPKKVKQESELKYHLTLHSGDREFKCNLCSFNVARSHFLDKHMLMHKSK